MKILLLENIHPVAQEKLKTQGFEVHCQNSSLPEKELLKVLGSYDALGIRSKTQVTAQVLKHSKDRLRVVGAFCIGVNQIDLKAAQDCGIPVFNAPYNNTRSVSELVIAEVISLSRNLASYNKKTHGKVWQKSAKDCHEIRNKVLGIVGYGHIGSQVSVLAEALGLRVIYYDIERKLPLGRAEPTMSLEELLRQSDFVTLHVPGNPSTENMINEVTLSQMKKGACLLNTSRGSVVDVKALKKALESGHLQGAALDVYKKEPLSNNEEFICELQGFDNVILTPHIAGSTEEAQDSIGVEMAEIFVRFLKEGNTMGAINVPQIQAPRKKGVRVFNIHQNKLGVLGKINSIVSEAKLNILEQTLSAHEDLGCLILDIEETKLDENVLEEIRKLPFSIKTYGI